IAANSPLYLELIGSIATKEHFLGIPRNTSRSLTSFEQAKDILNELSEQSVSNIHVRYSGWFNDGMDHTLPTKVKPEKSLGGKKGLQQLEQYAQTQGISIYPDVSFLKLHPQSSLTYSP